VFAIGHTVQASIAFVCDRSATGTGTVVTDPTTFMKPTAVASAGSGSASPGAPGAKTGPAFDAALFCNLNFTWKTSLVCDLPTLTEQHSSSWGWTFMLIVILGMSSYLVGGTFFRAQKTGADPSFWNNMPQREIWGEIPGMVRDGMNFVASGGQTQSHYSKFAIATEKTPLKGGGKKAPAKKKPAKKKEVCFMPDLRYLRINV
jgi:hypothetical protein